MENDEPDYYEAENAEEAIRILDEFNNKIEAEFRQEIGADYYETIQNGKDSIKNYEQTVPLPSNKNVINSESENKKLHTEAVYQFQKSAIYRNTKFNINKPRLEDYNVTQELYDNEIKKYQKEKEIISKQYGKRENIKLGIIFILVIIIGVAILPNTTGAILLIFSPIITGIIYSIISNRKESQEKIDSLNEVDNSIRASIIIQSYNKYLSDLKDYEAELTKFQKRIQMQKEKYWIDMKGHRFEKEIAALFSKFGYYSKVTPGSGDGGVDIILIKNDKKYYVQCKNHKKPVAPATARDLFGAMSHDGIINGVIVSTMGFTKGVYKFIKGKNIKLISLKEILKMVEHLK